MMKMGIQADSFKVNLLSYLFAGPKHLILISMKQIIMTYDFFKSVTDF